MWKTILVGNESILTVENNWLVVSRPDKLTRLPIDDVYSVVIPRRCGEPHRTASYHTTAGRFGACAAGDGKTV